MPRWYLSGPMGVGKTTVGRVLSARLGVELVDLDAEIERHAGGTVASIFRERGERAFRRLEEAVLSAWMREGPRDAVIALGGGTVAGRASFRRAILFDGVLVTLDAPPEVAASRDLARGEARPLLADGDPVEVLRGLAEERRAAYAECHGRISTEGRAPGAVADAVMALAESPPVVVPLGLRSYRVSIGEGVRRTLAERVGTRAGVLVVVTDSHVDAAWGADLAGVTGAASRVDVVLPPGEAEKHLGSVERIWDAAIAAGADRDALVLAAGGGVVGDLAGFAAATLFRGVSFAQLPTTLLAMVDSAVGGKTAIDRLEGKNLVGAFHQPDFVLCDTAFLATLPDRERVAGLAEVAKAAWLDGEDAVAALEADAEALRAGRDPGATGRAVRRAIHLKARIVSDDEREAGPRRLLNLGHTIGHALEAEAGFGPLRHGEAVALGMVAAFRVSAARGVATPQQATRATELLARLGLPTDLDRRLTPEVFRRVAQDKKRAGTDVRFVLPGAPGTARVERLPIASLPGWVAGS